ncbi:MAG: apolipoprotein N-acyltransferase [Bacteroidales bacterium]|nr:apolipoprotein N-acyltransferase [Bacteroidales bacterium]
MSVNLRLALSVLTGLLLGVAWSSQVTVFLIFVAFIPLFWVFSDLEKTPERKNGKRFYGYAFLAFLVWNVFTTWWVWNATPMAVFAFLINSTLMALMAYFYYIVKKHAFRGRDCLWVFAVFFTAFEFFHFDWDLSWPWLTLGNVFAWTPHLVQWYEFTGALGGSVWIWVVNILFFSMFKRGVYLSAWTIFIVGFFLLRLDTVLFYFFVPALLVSHRLLYNNFAFVRRRVKEQEGLLMGLKKPMIWKDICAISGFVFLPMIISVVIYQTFEERGDRKVEIVVVQPNIDPYEEQYEICPLEATERMLNLARKKVTPDTRLIVTPESMIQEFVWEHRIQYSPSIRMIQEFLSEFDSLELLAGLSTWRIVPERTHAARVTPWGEYFERHNAALLVGSNYLSEMYYKSKLTPGVEIMPFVGRFPFLEKLALDLGGTVGTLGISDERKVFHSIYRTPPFSAVICYELIFGDFVTGFVRNGAEFLAIMTNEGWWGDTPGHRQIARYTKLRAIETRRDIARSANTGISGFINQRGDFLQPTQYWTKDVIVQTIRANDQITFYVRFGDYIGRVAFFSAGLLLLLALVFRLRGWKDVIRSTTE